ncbi:MAG: hypothetical protein GDA49_04945 [Rhodospirillales bacterium]|nr:hypothetical protein [Rhodospirillales bacterium]
MDPRDNLPGYAGMIFFPRLAAFNIRWYEGEPTKAIDIDDGVSLEEEVLICPAMENFAGDVSQGGRVIEDCAAGSLALDDGGHVEGLETDQGVLTTNKVLLATGPDTGDVLAALPRCPPRPAAGRFRLPSSCREHQAPERACHTGPIRRAHRRWQTR